MHPKKHYLMNRTQRPDASSLRRLCTPLFALGFLCGAFSIGCNAGVSATPALTKGDTSMATPETAPHKLIPVSLGAADAPHTIAIYSSLSCQHCADFHLDIMPKLRTKYIDTKKARLVFYDFPLDEKAAKAAVIAWSGGAPTYLKALDVFFAQREAWVELPTNEACDKLKALASDKVGVAKSLVEDSLKTDGLLDAVLQSGLQGMKDFEITSTPTLVVDGHVYEDEIDESMMMSFIDKILTPAPH